MQYIYFFVYIYIYILYCYRYRFSYFIVHGEDKHLLQRHFHKEFSISWPQHWSFAEGDFQLLFDSHQFTEVWANDHRPTLQGSVDWDFVAFGFQGINFLTVHMSHMAVWGFASWSTRIISANEVCFSFFPRTPHAIQIASNCDHFPSSSSCRSKCVLSSLQPWLILFENQTHIPLQVAPAASRM